VAARSASILMGLPNGKKSIENLEKIIDNLYLRLYNIEKHEKLS